jgi:lysozyme
MSAVADWEPALQVVLPLLQEFEQGPGGGYAAVPYRCPAGKLTVGYGHVMTGREESELGHDLPIPMMLDEAVELLRHDARNMAAAIAPRLHVPLTVGMQAALISLAFNIGRYAFANSTLLHKLNAGDYQGAADQFLRWDKATDPRTGMKIVLAGLTRRRQRERELFLSEGVL